MVFGKKVVVEDRVEARFSKIVDIIKDLDKKEFNRLLKGMTKVWEGYQDIRQAKTEIEKEVEDIEKLERALGQE